MSFPPRPPYGMPMMSGGFSFTPMGMNMMPMPMMRPVMRPMAMTQVVQQQQQQQQQQNKQLKKLVPQDIPKTNEEKPPVTTVFVGSISERAPDMMIKQMLQRCGNVLSWKRVQGASGKLQAFGFCEFEYPEATLRCIRLLNEWGISEKKLKVKVDAKTKTLLDEYLKKKKSKDPTGAESDKDKDKEKKDGDSKENGDEKGEKKEKADKEEGEESGGDEVEELDENTMREDRVARAGLEAIMREYAFELAKEPPTPKPAVREYAFDGAKRPSTSKSVVEKEVKQPVERKKDSKEPRDVGFEDMDLEDDKKEMINKEIRMFRDMHKLSFFAEALHYYRVIPVVGLGLQ